MNKVTMLQAVRFLIDMVAVLVVLWAIVCGGTASATWEIASGTAILWFIGDTLSTIYLNYLFEQES